MSGSGKEAGEMYHYMDFDPYLIRERNRQIFREVQAMRLEEQLRENRMGGSPLFTFSLGPKSTLHLLRGACRAVVPVRGSVCKQAADGPNDHEEKVE